MAATGLIRRAGVAARLMGVALPMVDHFTHIAEMIEAGKTVEALTESIGPRHSRRLPRRSRNGHRKAAIPGSPPVTCPFGRTTSRHDSESQRNNMPLLLTCCLLSPRWHCAMSNLLSTKRYSL